MSVAVVQKTPSHIPVAAIEIARQTETLTSPVTLTPINPKTAPSPMPVITIVRRPWFVPSQPHMTSVHRPPIAIPAPIASMIQNDAQRASTAGTFNTSLK